MPSSDRGDEQDEQRQPLIADDEYHGNPARRRHHGESDSPRSVMHSVELSNGRRKPLKATEKMWVIATTSLISFLAFSSQFFVLIPYWLDTPGVTWSQILLCLLPFNIGVAAIFYNYYLVVFTNPGSVPAGWEPEWDAIAGVEVKASTGQPRYCKVCRSYKPPRAHHCRTCKRCVLRMDHHCPWVANCVGHGNYGHFLRFLYSVNFTMSIHVTLLCLRVADWWSPMVLWREPTTTDMVLMILNFAQGLPVLLMVGIFSMYHTYALCTNTTTIESWEKDKVATLIRRGKIEEIKFPYDLGMKKNIQSVLGRRMLFWCWPGAKPMGNGMDYSPGEGNGASMTSSSSSSRHVIRTYDIPTGNRSRAEQPPSSVSAAQRLAQNLRNGRPGVDAVFRSVANGAGRGGDGKFSPPLNGHADVEEELSVMA